ncbi:MAG: hypothetical protein ACRENA_00450 [Vulcanimicrobiaceae bacterium]
MIQYRHRLAEAVLSRLRTELPGISANFGEDFEASDEPEAQMYRGIGGKFRWVAFGFAPWRFWDLHVGVVETDDGRHSLGFHISERASAALMPELEMLAERIGSVVIHQTIAVEYQANRTPITADDRDFNDAVNAAMDLCRDFARVATRVAVPPGFR